MNKDYKNLVKLSPVGIPEMKDVYEISIECDANDGDYMDDEFEVGDIYEDELYFLVLCYLSSDCYGWCLERNRYKNKSKLSKCDSWSAIFGRHVDEDINFSWLESYLSENELLIFAGMCDSMCHSVTSLDIVYYDSSGNKFDVRLPQMNEIFIDQNEMIDYMNNLAKQEGYNV